VAPKSEQLLTEKLEKDIDTLLRRWLNEKITHLTRDTVCDLLTNFGVFQNYANNLQKLQSQVADV
jgi:hypothetical protein